MRNLLDLIISNLIPIIIVVSVIIRIVTSVKKTSRGEPALPEAPDDEAEADVWRRLRPDDDEGKPAATFSRPLLSPVEPAAHTGAARGGTSAVTRGLAPDFTPGFTAPGPGRPAPGFTSDITPGVTPATAGPLDQRPGAVEGPAAKVPGGALGRLERLSPLRRAVVLAEILGAPKGLSNSPANL
jgi:hypothetical protein